MLCTKSECAAYICTSSWELGDQNPGTIPPPSSRLFFSISQQEQKTVLIFSPSTMCSLRSTFPQQQSCSAPLLHIPLGVDRVRASWWQCMHACVADLLFVCSLVMLHIHVRTSSTDHYERTLLKYPCACRSYRAPGFSPWCH